MAGARPAAEGVPDVIANECGWTRHQSEAIVNALTVDQSLNVRTRPLPSSSRPGDGNPVCTVSARVLPEDRQALLDLFGHSSLQTRSSRFHHALSVFPQRYLEEILRGEQLALVARDSCNHETPGAIVGLASAAQITDRTAEIAVWVGDGWQRRGVGGLLVRRILTLLCDQKFREAVAFIEPSNMAARGLLERCCPHAAARMDGGLLRVAIPLSGPTASW
jgi:RimJ/RimL family protein N-acetyltransferase